LWVDNQKKKDKNSKHSAGGLDFLQTRRFSSEKNIDIVISTLLFSKNRFPNAGSSYVMALFRLDSDSSMWLLK
jgi:hypothetical protein